MYCKHCGKEISDDSRFCNHCGKALEETKKVEKETPQRETEKKIFYNHVSFNEKVVRNINEWLKGQSIEIKSVAVSAGVIHLPWKTQTVPTRVEIEYYKTQTEKRYSMGHFCGLYWFANPRAIKKVDEDFENWQRQNPDKKVVWKTNCGHQVEGGTTRTLYFLYV